MKKLFILFCLVYLISSCKRETIIQGKNSIVTEDPSTGWRIIRGEEYFFPSTDYQVLEEKNGSLTIRVPSHIFNFDSIGNLKSSQAIDNGVQHKGFAFLNTGNFFSTISKRNDNLGSDHIQFHERNKTNARYNTVLTEIRKRDSINIFTYEYEIKDIDLMRLSWLSNNPFGNYALIMALKQELPIKNNPDNSIDIIVMRGTTASNLHPLTTQELNTNGNANFDKINNNNKFVVISNSAVNTISNKVYDINFDFIADNNKNQVIDINPVLNKFVVRNSGNYYLSENSINLESKINGLSATYDAICASRDSFLFVKNYESVKTINAINSFITHELSLTDPRIPSEFRNTQLYYYYTNKVGTQFFVFSDGILTIPNKK